MRGTLAGRGSFQDVDKFEPALFIASQGAVPAGVKLCGGDEMARSIHDSFQRLKAGDESAAIFNRDAGELMIRPRSTYRNL